MLRFPSIPGGETGDILKRFVNNRLIALMEQEIFDELAWRAIYSGSPQKVERDPKNIDIQALSEDLKFADSVAMPLLPRHYELEKANREFFGLYKLLKAKGEYVPELPMEYIMHSLIDNAVREVDMYNEDIELFHPGESMQYTTIARIPEPDRSVVLQALQEEAEELSEELGKKYTAEDLILRYEDMRNYYETCFWDYDYEMLDMMDEDTLIHSSLGKTLGISERRDVQVIEVSMGMETIRGEMNIAPWEHEDDVQDDAKGDAQNGSKGDEQDNEKLPF